MRLIRDSRSKPSWTLTLAVPALIGITVWFILGGLDLTLPGGLHILTATKSGTDYAFAIGPWIAFICNRQWAKGGNSGTGTVGEPGD